MAELMDLLGELRTLPEQLHLLCPRQNDDDMGLYNDEAVQSATALSGEDTKPNVEILNRISEANARREKFLSCMRLLAFSGEEVETHQAWIWGRLEEMLEKCDLCIKEYYKGKSWLMGMLGESYDEAEVEKFGKIVDEWDIKRIVKNLDRATVILKAVPAQERNLSALDRASLLSIFEALSSEALLKEEDILVAHFDEPFRLVQSNRSLKISDYVPASTRFLFGSNEYRSHWAVYCWSKFPRPPSTVEFDWAIKEPLLAALREASAIPFQGTLVERLWKGLLVIIKRLDNEQITHNLRALEIDACRLSVDHVAVQTPALRSVLNAIQILLEKAPGDFWDAMQTISPQAIIEQIFYNPQYEAFLLQTTDTESLDKSPLKDMLCWINPFMTSLKGAHQPQACRFLVAQLLNRLQDPRFPTVVRYHCFRAGLSVLILTLRTFTDNEASRGSVARILLSDTLEVISNNINYFLDPPKFLIEGSQQDISSLCMDVIRNTLALECQSLKSDYEVILRKKSMQDGVSTYSSSIWDAVVKHLHEDNLPLSRAALMGILPLVGLEKFQTKGDHSKEKTHFNVIYGHLTHLACQILERLADFKPEHLDNLFKSHDTGSVLISALFSADLNTYQAAVDLIKTISGQSGRKEAISHLLQSFYSTTMYGFSWSFRRISNMKTFASAPRMIKTGTDIIEVLCDSQTGILRTRKLADRREIFALQKLWEFQWQALTTIFEQTETWHMMGNDRSVMLEFCRDTIQFADLLFDQFAVFAGAISEADASESDSAKSALLQSPTTTMNGMVKWLRLKDEYLATTLVGLVSKLLRRLGELNVTVAQDALTFMEGVALKFTIKTILTDREKAELVRALEAYYKKPLVAPPPAPAAPKKQSRITAFAKPVDESTTSSPSRASAAEDEFEDEDIPDDVLMKLSGSVELNKARIAAQQKKLQQKAVKPPTSVAVKRPTPMVAVKNDQNVMSFREKREREREAKKKRDMLELARLKKRANPLVNDQTRNQGSGLQDINVGVIDHTPVESMMVSSESESESDSDDDTSGSLIGRKPRKPDAVKAYEESRKKSLQQRVPVKKTKVVRSAKDMRARLMPDLSMLHRTLLSWDFFANGDLPPNSDRKDYALVSNTFTDATEYQRTFEPLLVLEAWQGFQSAKEDGTFKTFEIKVANRLSVDSFVEVSTVMQPQEVKELGLGEADIVLLSRSSNPASDSKAPHCLARVSAVTKKKGVMEVSYRVNTSGALGNLISPGGTVFGTRITSLTPLEREYGALMALRYYDLSDEIIHAKPSPILNYRDESVKDILDTYKVNLAQAKAVKSALDNDAFTLIQGPPGSGKTKTIVALVGALLTSTLAEGRIAPLRKPNEFTPATRTTTSKKLLVCAPSNAAVDELVMRFKEGVKTLSGKHHKLSVIRLGRSDAINTAVMDVTLDELVNARMNLAVPKKGGERDLQSYYTEHKDTANKFNEVRERLDQFRAKAQAVPSELEREFDLLKRKKLQLSQTIDNVRDKNHSAARNADLTRRKIQQEIMDDAHVICATLSGSGHDMFQTLSIEFETVIIDEAAQSIELSALIPLKYGCSKCVLVGDPKQLPPTVLSKVASRFQYEQSLFVRMQANHPKDVHLLDTQYRMHPEISRFPSAAFYDGKLRDGAGMAELRKKPWHGSALLGPYRFFDVQGMHASAPKGHSLVNMAELQVAMKLYERLTSDYGTLDFAGKVGIITPYKGQLKELKAQFAARYGNSIFTAVEFNTTDAFQGRECEVIIFSCVRASRRGIGFLADIRRMNVGLTRAKSSLWVLGNSRSLVQGEFWKGLIEDAHARNLYTEGDIMRILDKPQISLDMELKDVEMVDATSANNNASAPPSRPGSVVNISRPSSALSSGRVSAINDAMSSSVRNTPSQSPKLGPSGGANGLNDRATCGYCGSYEHMTHGCDNLEAQRASRGVCFRCGDASHTKKNCTADRCLQCGEIGHLSKACKSTKVLNKREKDRIAKEEYRHQQTQRVKIEQQRQRQLGDHDPKVPVIQVSSRTASPGPKDPKRHAPQQRQQQDQNSNPAGKRKASELDMQNPGRDPKMRKSDTNFAPPPNAPTGPRGRKLDPHTIAPPTSDLVIPSKNAAARQPINSRPETGQGPGPGLGQRNDNNGPPTPRPGGAPPRPRMDSRGPPPPIRRKKQVDPFIRPKRR
ncbi:hypothetical protein AJ80_01908 [Polytolypa hystricis UAMH7299]|uniref:CCHC-type domain-containing protein n=1 Tax=Polytolypa hystricis (strain UAMH7299) TaxID=1447883 RepID=A0A2B7YZ40_POLH7|nr:hypothetical protein AJ80_01908 [Polytolypa hystricis UAMH7299]